MYCRSAVYILLHSYVCGCRLSTDETNHNERKGKEKTYAVSFQKYVFVVTRRVSVYSRIYSYLFLVWLRLWLFVLYIYEATFILVEVFYFYLCIRRVVVQCLPLRLCARSYVTRHSIVHDDQNKRVHSRFVNNVWLFFPLRTFHYYSDRRCHTAAPIRWKFPFRSTINLLCDGRRQLK